MNVPDLQSNFNIRIRGLTFSNSKLLALQFYYQANCIMPFILSFCRQWMHKGNLNADSKPHSIAAKYFKRVEGQKG